MKKRFLDYSLKLITNNNPNLSSEKKDELCYGLEGFYLTITKAIFIFSLAYLLGIFKETLIMLIFFNILRTTGFGLHAKKSWMCWVSSTILFIFLPFISRYIVFPLYLKYILGCISIILIALYAPADTIKHPLINKNKRIVLKMLSITFCTLLVILSIIIKNETIDSLIIFGIYVEISLIIPITYKLFHLSYNNYKNYILKNNLS
jgi:putative agrB-like protein